MSFTHEPGNPASIANGWVELLYEDRAGNFWVGTRRGLDRFDRSMGTFAHCFDDSISGQVRTFYEDREGNLWVGTSKGLHKFDQATGAFTHYILDPQTWGIPRDGGGESSNAVLAVGEDQYGSLWIGSGDGLYVFNQSTASFKRYRHDKHEPGSIAHNRVNAIFKDRSGVLWFGTGGGLDSFDRESGSFVHHWHYPGRLLGVPNASVYWITSIYEDKAGSIWLATRGGLVAYDKSNGTCVLYEHKPNDPDSFSGGAVTALCEDQEGTLWVGTSGGGLNAFDRKSGKFSHFVHDERDPGSLSAGDIVCIYPERSGSLWIAATIDWWGGVNKLNRTKPLFTQYVGGESKQGNLSSSEINDVFEDSKGTIWISTAKGLESFDPRTETFLHQAPREPVWSIAEDFMGNLWIAGQHGGLYRRDQHGKATRFCDSARHEFQPVVVSICPARDGTVWLGTRRGLFELDPVTNKVRAVGPSEPLNGVHEDAAGLLWIGTTNYGLLCYDRSRDSTMRFTSDPKNPATPTMNTIITIHEDKAGVLWLGTGLGLNRYDRSTGTFSHFTTKDGLPFDVVMGSVEDNQGNLWLATIKGLSKFDPRTKIFKNYDVSDGLAGNELVAFCRARNGEMYFGGRRGLNRFQPDSIRHNPFVPPIVVTSIRQSDQPLSVSKEIRLSYRENSLSFEFVALSYVSPEKNRYTYMMEGLDHAWSQPTTRHYASYPHLEPGDYVFRVRGSNNDGVWNEEGTSIAVIITPPPWKTTWAYLFYAVVVGGTLYRVRRYQINKLKNAHHLEMVQMEAATLREVDKMKSDFFANISHEFRTPLSLILGPVESLAARTGDMKSREELEMIHRNARRLHSLVNQLLDLSKIEAGQMKIRPRELDIVECVRGVADSFELLAARRGIQFALKSNEPIIGHFDPDLVEKILMNLLSNAFKFSHDGGQVSVSVSCWGDAAEKGELSTRSEGVDITVSDTGIGIPGDQIEKIFDRFYQVDNSRTKEHEGTGIGLALTRDLVRLCNGRITVTSQIGIGTSFIVSLPLGRREMKTEANVPVASEGGAEERMTIEKPVELSLIRDDDEQGDEGDDEADNGRSLILIIEDNADMRSHMREQLGRTFNVIEADNGLKGVEKATTAVPDLIVSDVMMPKMDGFEVCRHLKGDVRTSHIPIILLTAKAGMENKIEGLEMGADDYLTKPFEAKELLARITNLIELRRKLRERFSASQVLKPGEIAVTSMDDVFLRRVLVAVEDCMADESFGVEELGNRVGLSRSQLHRKLTALTGQSPSDFVRYMRLHRAKDLLEKNAGTVSEIAYMVGFGGVSYFTKCFKGQFGFLPSELKNRD